MKKKDGMGHEIREGMKQVIREHGFKYWFREVFWYHYGKLSVGILAAVIIAVLITVEGARQPKYDFNMVMALDGEVAYSFTEELREVITMAVGDVDGDGEVNINLQIIDLGDEENLEANQNRLQLVFAQPEYTLYIMDERYSAIYCEREYFDPAQNYGFEPDTAYDRRVDINSAPVIERLNARCRDDLTLYAGICDWTVDGKGKKEWTDAAVRALDAILSAE